MNPIRTTLAAALAIFALTGTAHAQQSPSTPRLNAAEADIRSLRIAVINLYTVNEIQAEVVRLVTTAFRPGATAQELREVSVSIDAMLRVVTDPSRRGLTPAARRSLLATVNNAKAQAALALMQLGDRGDSYAYGANNASTIPNE